MPKNWLLRVSVGYWLCLTVTGAAPAALEQPARGLTFIPGTVNGVRLEHNGKTLAVYGDPRPNPPAAAAVLFTHSRRDVIWAGRPLMAQGAVALVPASETPLLLRPQEFWSAFEQTVRFHNYKQVGTKVIAAPLEGSTRVLAPGETFQWEGLPIAVLATPGYTAGAVTYLVTVDGKKIAFTGDLIYGDGRLLDLYSFQDAVPEAKIGGYHGYAARLGDLMHSLRRLQEEKPDLIIPARGPIIQAPATSIATLIGRVEGVYSNYLTIDALRWYFGDAHIRTKAQRVLGAQTVKWMDMAETNALPEWVTEIDNTRLIRSADGSGFLIDCGSKHILDELRRMQQAGKFKSLDHVFISHYHDDHTDQVPAVAQTFGATVLACRELWDVLERPGAYALPCLTRNPIAVSGRLTSGAHWTWKEFDLTAYYFPGQTLYHQALLVQKQGAESILFVGDSFTPTGIDDYCLQNRNFVHPDSGYFRCLSMIEALPAGCWLVNQHVPPMFRFSPAQLEQMRSTLQKRVELFGTLFPWDDPNYGLDESWARLNPYGITAQREGTFSCRAIVFNHSSKEGSFSIQPHLPSGWILKDVAPSQVWIAPLQEGAIQITVSVPAEAKPGLHIITADVATPQGDFREWVEAMIQIAQ